MHEKSGTVQWGNRWWNISGITGKILKPKFDFEKESYQTVEEAVSAAKKRSKMFDQVHTLSSKSKKLTKKEK